MAHHREEVVPNDFSKWRVDLLRTVLASSGVGLMLVSVVRAFGATSLRSVTLQGCLLGVVCLFGIGVAERAPHLLSALYGLAATGLIAQVFYGVGWSPGAVAALISLLVYVGLLMGRAAVAAVVAVIVAVLVIRGIAIERIGLAPEVSAHLSLDRWHNWVQQGAMFVAITAVAAWGLGRMGRLLGQAESRLRLTVALAREHCSLLDSAIQRRAKSEQGLRNAQKLQSVAQLGQGFGHLFNDVLTIISSAIEEARFTQSSEELANAAVSIREAVSAAALRTKELLALFRPHEATASTLHVRDAFSQLGPRLRARLRANVELIVDNAAQGRLDVSELWLDQVLTNLLFNAEQAMSEGGRIEVIVRQLLLDLPRQCSCKLLQPGRYVVIRVQDAGHGMSDEVRERAFDPFFTTRPNEGHEGLGLTMVYSMVAGAGGSVEIECPSEGASIAVYLPCQLADEEARVTERESLAASPLARTEIESWQASALELVTRLCAMGIATAVLVTEAYTRWAHAPTRLHVAVGVPSVLSFGFAGWFWRGSTRSRMFQFTVTSLITALALIATLGFMAPTPVALACLTILFLWMLGESRLAVAGLVIMAIAFIGIGYIYSTGHLIGMQRAVSVARPENWYRVAVNLNVMSVVAAMVVLHVLGVAQRRVASLAVVEANLRETKNRLESESNAIANIEAMTARAARLESLGRITGMMAHDLNNSLLALGTWSDVIREEQMAPSNPELASILDSMVEVAQYSEALVSSLELRTPRIQGSIAVGTVTERMQGPLSAVLRRQQKLTIRSAPQGWACIDEHSYRRILFNLVANARDAMTNDGHCQISVREIDKWIEVAVEDDGCGMSPETMEKAFEMFFTTKGRRGTGVGLHQVASSIHCLGGFVEAQSKLNEGTRITCRIPRATERSSSPTRPTIAAKVRGSGKILLVEENVQLRVMLRQRLEASGFDVQPASSGIVAWERIVNGASYAALCTDSIIPGKPARLLIEEFLRRSPKGLAVLMSGFFSEDVEEIVQQNREIRFLRKPFAAGELASLLARNTAR